MEKDFSYEDIEVNGEKKEKNNIFFQKIFFGSPGVGKSYQILDDKNPKSLKNILDLEKENIFRTIFHPEYKYGDFIGKLLPHTENGNITYKFYAGEFLKALAKAYRNILDNPENPKSVLFIIDEINRGNCSAIFGKVFQLLDRNNEGWSEYEIMISDLEFISLLKLMGYEVEKIDNNDWKFEDIKNKHLNSINIIANFKETEFKNKSLKFLLNQNISLPPNLSIVGTMNTSDESIFYMDSAFKRRWDWEYIPTEIDEKFEEIEEFEETEKWWKGFYPKLKRFILDNAKYVRKAEDKLIGKYFIKKDYSKEKIKNKLLFFLWDTVFQRDKTPLNNLLEKELIIFDDFAKEVENFIEKINKYKSQ